MLRIICLFGGSIASYCHATDLRKAYGDWNPSSNRTRSLQEERFSQDVEIREGAVRQQRLLGILQKKNGERAPIEWDWIRQNKDDSYLSELLRNGPIVVDYHLQDIEPKDFYQCLNAINKAALTQMEVAIFLSNNYLDELCLERLHNCVERNPLLKQNLRFLDITYSRTSQNATKKWVQKILDLCMDITISY